MAADLRHFLTLLLVASSPAFAGAEWQAVEKVKTYAISGTTGPELYESIGFKGPLLNGKVRTIAHTDFKLTWSRNYVPQDGVCTLVSAVPKLTITYTLPKPARKLPAAIARNWETFFKGLSAHEKVHGEMIKTLVRDIEAATVGMSVADDPKCVKIREELKQRLTVLFQAYKQKTHDFDRTEMSDGGNVHQLILALVNGG